MNRFNVTKNGYKFDKVIFWGSMILIFGLVFYLMDYYNYDFSSTNIYVKCEQEVCENPLNNIKDCKQQLNILWVIPLYKANDCRQNCEDDWCNWKYLPEGEYGKKPNSLFRYMYPLTFGVIILSLLLNHLIHNRGKKFDIEIPFTKKKRLNIREFLKKMKEKDNE